MSKYRIKEASFRRMDGVIVERFLIQKRILWLLWITVRIPVILAVFSGKITAISVLEGVKLKFFRTSEEGSVWRERAYEDAKRACEFLRTNKNKRIKLAYFNDDVVYYDKKTGRIADTSQELMAYIEQGEKPEIAEQNVRVLDV